MTRQDFIHKKFPLICLVLSLVIFTLSLTDFSGIGDLEKTASDTEDEVKGRIEALNSLIVNTISGDPAKATDP